MACWLEVAAGFVVVAALGLVYFLVEVVLIGVVGAAAGVVVAEAVAAGCEGAVCLLAAGVMTGVELLS